MTHANPVGLGRYIFWGVASALLAAFLAWAFMPTAVPVDVTQVTRGAMDVRVEGEGRTRVKDIYTLSAPVTGRLLRIAAEAGDQVQAGQTQLAVIEPVDPSILDKRTRAEAEAQVEAAEDSLGLAAANVDRARAELIFAQSELARAAKLFETQNVSQRALDVAKLEVATRDAALKSAEATVKVRAHELENARAHLMAPNGDAGGGECCVILKAPVDGQVLRVLVQSEGVVQAGAPLIEVGDPRNLEVVVDLLTADAARIAPGAEVVVSNWGGADLQGRVRRVEPFGYTKVSVLGVEEQRVDVIIDFSDPHILPETLGHGFHTQVGILEWSAPDVLKAPLAAVFRSNAGWAVFVLDEEGRARLTSIEVGRMNGREVQVLSGLGAGDRVIVHPGERVRDGVRATVREN